MVVVASAVVVLASFGTEAHHKHQSNGVIHIFNIIIIYIFTVSSSALCLISSNYIYYVYTNGLLIRNIGK